MTTTTKLSPQAVRSDALGLLADKVRACTACTAARNPPGLRVIGSGSTDARLVLIGEAPGGTEEQIGRPFQGPSGVILDTWLLQAGYPVSPTDAAKPDRDALRIMNSMCCRPVDPGKRPGAEINRTPTGIESKACRPHAIEQLRIIMPAAVVVIGEKALRLLAPSMTLAAATRRNANNYAIPRDAGFEWCERMAGMPCPPRGIRVFAVYHPAAVLRYRGTEPEKAKMASESAIDVLGQARRYVEKPAPARPETSIGYAAREVIRG
jgi:uracil-DNA glycosylase family 4